MAMSRRAIKQEAPLSRVIVSLPVLPVLAADILAMSFLSLPEDLREFTVKYLFSTVLVILDSHMVQAVSDNGSGWSLTMPASCR